MSVSRRGIISVCQPHRATTDTASVSVSRIARLQIHHQQCLAAASRDCRRTNDSVLQPHRATADAPTSVSCSRITRLQIHHHQCLTAASLDCRRTNISVLQPHRSAAEVLSVSVSRIARLQTQFTQLFSQLRGYHRHLARLQRHHQCRSAAEVSSVSVSHIARLQIQHQCLSAASRDYR